MNNKIEYIIFDADNLIDKLINYKFVDNIQILDGTRQFILDFYEELEKYRKNKNDNKIVISVSTIRDSRFLYAYERLLCILNDNENIVFGNGYCSYEGVRRLMKNNYIDSDYIVNNPVENNYTLSNYYDDLRYLGLDNIIIIGDDSYDDYNKEFKCIENACHLRYSYHLNHPTIRHIVLDNVCFYNDNRLYLNRKNVIDGIKQLSNNCSSNDKYNLIGSTKCCLSGYQNIKFFENDKQIMKVKKLNNN